MDLFLNKWSDSKFIGATGLRKCVFAYLFCRYCGLQTPVKTFRMLYDLFVYFKLYPVTRAFHTTFKHYCQGWFLSQIHHHASYLASVIDELSSPWNARAFIYNRLPQPFDVGIVGCIDTFPIYVSRPANAAWQSHLYNGKYKGHVVKVTSTFFYCIPSCHSFSCSLCVCVCLVVLQIQAVCDHSGCIIWFSGPHIGTTSDIKLYQQFTPPLVPGERLLGDKAYVSRLHSLIAPIKRLPHRSLTNDQKDYNELHRW